MSKSARGDYVIRTYISFGTGNRRSRYRVSHGKIDMPQPRKNEFKEVKLLPADVHKCWSVISSSGESVRFVSMLNSFESAVMCGNFGLIKPFEAFLKHTTNRNLK